MRSNRPPSLGCTRSRSVRLKRRCAIWTVPSPTSTAAASSSSTASCVGRSATLSARPESVGWGASASPAALLCLPMPSSCPPGTAPAQERDYLPTDAHILSATVSEQAGHWYVSVLVEQEHVALVNRGPVVGVDLGVKMLATLSDGTTEP